MKKILSFILAVIMIAMPMCVQSHASDVNYDDLVAPCHEYLTAVTTAIATGVLGFVKCSAQFTSYETDKTFSLTCSLMRSTESGWETYKSDTKTYTGAGNYSIDRNWFAPSGYEYKSLAKVVVQNASGTKLETVTVQSVKTIDKT